ncbi:hypothetical protein FNJ87_08440 [Nonlabens mediterrranea]|uniref:Arginyl-tRNA synthetase n=1 Tax=Nonlabens mediterrranea TaxID=1419947 RepID=A0ABS0A4R0_9FLAO|nr:hypothetical protein [Nonlabens mediterrranea]
MLYNVSYNDPETRRLIEKDVGKVLSLRQRWKLNGSGSPKLHIASSSIQIHNLLVVDNSLNVCNIELREKGIIVRFRSRLQTYALPIPYYKLNIYKGRAEEYSIYRDNYFIKVKANRKPIHDFFKKVSQLKGGAGFTYVDDL